MKGVDGGGKGGSESWNGTVACVCVIAGLCLIGLGILLLTGNFSLPISFGYRLFQFIEYERLLDYL